jgi:hypothetical protein
MQSTEPARILGFKLYFVAFAVIIAAVTLASYVAQRNSVNIRAPQPVSALHALGGGFFGARRGLAYYGAGTML